MAGIIEAGGSLRHFRDLVERLVYNAGIEQFIDLLTHVRLASTQLNALFKHLPEGKKSLSSELLLNSQLSKVVALTYRPGVRERILRDGDGLLRLNVWIPSNVVEVPGDASIFEEHLRYLCSSDQEFDVLADSLAFHGAMPRQEVKLCPRSPRTPRHGEVGPRPSYARHPRPPQHDDGDLQ